MRINSSVIKRSLIALLLICIFAGTAAPQDQKRINVGLIYDINSLYPWGQVSLEPQIVMKNIYETPFRADSVQALKDEKVMSLILNF